MDAEGFRLLFEYNAWANDRVLEKGRILRWETPLTLTLSLEGEGIAWEDPRRRDEAR